MRLLSGLLLVVVCLPASAEDKPKEKPRVTGAIEFKQKPTFLEGTEVKIQIQDVSIADAKAVVLGEKIIKDPKKTPIAFEVEYDGDKIKQNGRYSITCRITHKGKLLYVTDVNVPVITGKGGTKDVKVPVAEIKR
jgi:putative lipoprotein